MIIKKLFNPGFWAGLIVALLTLATVYLLYPLANDKAWIDLFFIGIPVGEIFYILFVSLLGIPLFFSTLICRKYTSLMDWDYQCNICSNSNLISESSKIFWPTIILSLLIFTLFGSCIYLISKNKWKRSIKALVIMTILIFYFLFSFALFLSYCMGSGIN